MKRKLILKTIACGLLLGGCAALTTCTKQKPNVLQTQQVRRANEPRITTLESYADITADEDITYYSTFYLIRNTTPSTATFTLWTNDGDEPQINIPITQDYQIIVFYNVEENDFYECYYDLYYYDIFNNTMSTISTSTKLNKIDLNIDINCFFEKFELENYNGYVGTYSISDGIVNEIMGNDIEAVEASAFYSNNYLNYIQPHLLGDAQATINQLLIDYRDAMREVNALETIVESKDNEISSLNDRIDNLNTLHEQEITELENTIAEKNGIIENLQELDNLPTHLGGWMQLVINLLQNLWNMELLPHVKLGYFVALPILFTLVSLLIKLVRGA